jgi:hypothetical protein
MRLLFLLRLPLVLPLLPRPLVGSLALLCRPFLPFLLMQWRLVRLSFASRR